MPGNTRTGGVLEAMILPALDRGGYQHQAQVAIGDRMGCGKHIVDVVAERDDRKFLVSVKWQQVSGTAEQKVPFEVICLLDALDSGGYSKAYLVLGGEGWKLRHFYVDGGLKRYLPIDGRVDIITLEGFVAKANSAKL
jgi:hypothetical protein